jgi:hypothetical protein
MPNKRTTRGRPKGSKNKTNYKKMAFNVAKGFVPHLGTAHKIYKVGRAIHSHFKKPNLALKASSGKIDVYAKDGMSFSTTKHIYNNDIRDKELYKAVEAAGQTTIYDTNATWRVNSNVGRQGIICLTAGSLFVNTDILALQSLQVAPQTGVSSGNIAQFPNTSGSFLLTSTGGNYQTQDIFLHQGKTVYSFTNQNLGSCNLQLYDCVPRHDITNDVFAPDYAWLQGVYDQGNMATGLANQGTPGVQQSFIGGRQPFETPFGSKFFTTTYKVINEKNICLKQGETHQHTVTMKPNAKYNMYRQILTSSGIGKQISGIANLPVYTMAVWIGQPANDSVNKTQISYESITLDIIMNKRVEAKQLLFKTVNQYIVNNLPLSFTNNPNIVDEGSGTVVTDGAAA